MDSPFNYDTSTSSENDVYRLYTGKREGREGEGDMSIIVETCLLLLKLPLEICHRPLRLR